MDVKWSKEQHQAYDEIVKNAKRLGQMPLKFGQIQKMKGEVFMSVPRKVKCPKCGYIWKTTFRETYCGCCGDVSNKAVDVKEGEDSNDTTSK